MGSIQGQHEGIIVSTRKLAVPSAGMHAVHVSRLLGVLLAHGCRYTWGGVWGMHLLGVLLALLLRLWVLIHAHHTVCSALLQSAGVPPIATAQVQHPSPSQLSTPCHKRL